MPVASCQVLTGDDGHTHLRGLEQYQFGMVIGKEAMVDSLRDEGPQTQRLIGCLVIEQQLYVLDLAGATDVVEATDELLGYREGCLADGSLSLHLGKAPLHHVGHLQLVRQVSLYRTLLQGA